MVTVKLESGHFEASLRIPLDDTAEKHKAYIDRWLMLIETGLKQGIEELEATLSKEIKSP